MGRHTGSRRPSLKPLSRKKRFVEKRKLIISSKAKESTLNSQIGSVEQFPSSLSELNSSVTSLIEIATDEISIILSSTENSSLIQSSTAEASFVQSSTAEASFVQSSTAEASFEQSSTDEASFEQSSTDEASFSFSQSISNDEAGFMPTSTQENQEIETERCLVTVTDTETKIHQDNGHATSNTHNITENRGQLSSLPILQGYRIVEIGHIISEIRSLETQTCKKNQKCLFEFENETRIGLISTLNFECKFCKKRKSINTSKTIDSSGGAPRKHFHGDGIVKDNSKELSLNYLAVWGFVSIGSGFENMDEVFSILGVPNMSKPTYLKREQELGEFWENVLAREMSETGKVEKELAIHNGDVSEDGIPYVTVIVDGGWSHRSHGHRYSAKCGVACIIGARTKGLLFIAMRSKYCCICSMNSENKEMPKHKCFKNWDGSSPAMESDILIEGFNKSEAMHGIQYRTIIGDGDSSVHIKLQENVSYGHKIKKSECANHVVRNYRKKIYALAKQAVYKTALSQSRIVRLGKGMRSAIKHVSQEMKKDINKTEGCENEQLNLVKVYKKYAELLRKDIRNVHNHVFGRHQHCREYFCTKKGPNRTCLLSKALEMKLLESSQRVQDLAFSLLDDETNNLAENYMSLVAKAVGGKQICYNRRGSYFTRCIAAGLQFQMGRRWHAEAIRTFTNRSPSTTVKKHVSRSQNQKIWKRKCLLKQLEATKDKKNHVDTRDEKNYGESSEKPDMTEEDMNRREIEVLNELSVSVEEQGEIQQRTSKQSDSEEWKLQRSRRITASNFGTICKRRIESGFSKLVKNFLYPKPFTNSAVQWGKAKEKVTIRDYERMRDTTVTNCGIFIDLERGYLGASPDGHVGDDGLLEVKCPYSARFLNPLDAPKSLSSFCSQNIEGTLKLKRNHNYYYQVQAQLHISNRKYCDFIIWTTKGMEIERILPDPLFWSKILPKLDSFYKECMLPEIIDPCFTRSREIREPASVKLAIDKRASKQRSSSQSVKVNKKKRQPLSDITQSPKKRKLRP